MYIILVGRGKMAEEMEKVCAEHKIQVKRMESGFNSPCFCGPPVAVHFGSGRELLKLIDFCEAQRISIIQGSTDVEVPKGRRVAIIQAPNLSLEMIRFMKAFPDFAQAIKAGMQMQIIESHQESKKGQSGTALEISKNLGFPVVTSIRDPKIQSLLGIPEESLSGHAVHNFVFSGKGIRVEVTTTVLGRRTYAEGALVLARAVSEVSMNHGIYELKDVFHLLPI